MSAGLIASTLLAASLGGPLGLSHPTQVSCSEAASAIDVLLKNCNTAPTPAEFRGPPGGYDRDETGRGGRGNGSECHWEYQHTFDPADPTADITSNSSGRRQDFYDEVCNGQIVGYRWVDSPVGGQPAISAADLVPGVWVSVQRQLPTPIARIAPADFERHGFAFVQNPTFFWVDQAQGQWAPVTGSSSAGGITVSVQATPQRLVVDTGDGETVTCERVPPAFVQGMDPTTFQGCEHVYRDSSAMSPNGETFPVTVTIEWTASWSASDGQGGSLGTRRTMSAPRQLAVAESQAIVTHAGD
jgi:hypothetical protein